MNRYALLAVITTAALVPAGVEAQRTPRRQAPIEIIGQVPTPQVVTVRPREVPAYDRRVLVPTFYDHDFWQSILPGYLLVRERTITGAVGDSATVRRDSTPPAIANPPAGSVTPPPAGSPPPTGSPPPPTATQSPAPDATPDAARRSPPAAVSPALPPR
jgi:hypothetical protein